MNMEQGSASVSASGNSGGVRSNLLAHKPSKASLTSVSSSRRIPDKTVPRVVVQRTQLCFRMADICISLLVVFPLVIGFWRGVWNLSYHYSTLYGVDPWLSIGVGYLIPLMLHLFQEPLRKHVRPRKMNYFLFYITSRTLLLLHSIGSVNQWRGLWALLDDNFGTGWISALTSVIVGIACSIGLKTFCNVLAPPLFLAVDDASSIHDCPLRFQTTIKSKFSYLWDCLLSVFVVASLIIASWRGLWELAELYLFPEDLVMSAVTSLMIGYAIALTLFLTQPIIRSLMEKVKGFNRLLLADSITFVGFVCCVFSWRGLWTLYDAFLGTPNYSDWVTFLVGAVGSTLLGCISTIITRGVAVDGDVGSDGTSEWPIPYVSLLRDTVHDVPFPEPWLFRYLCSTQKMNLHHLTMRRQKRQASGSDGAQASDQAADINTKVTIVIGDGESGGNTASVQDTEKAKDTVVAQMRHIDTASNDEDDEHTAFLNDETQPRIITASEKEIELSALKKVANKDAKLRNQRQALSSNPSAASDGSKGSFSTVQSVDSSPGVRPDAT